MLAAYRKQKSEFRRLTQTESSNSTPTETRLDRALSAANRLETTEIRGIIQVKISGDAITVEKYVVLEKGELKIFTDQLVSIE